MIQEYDNNIGVSVIMPTYNQEAFIMRAVKSLLGQSIQNWELIIIDDGCTDHTYEVLSTYIDNIKIKYFRNLKNIGLGASLNKGLDLAKFNYISYLPSDDVYYSNHLEILLEKILNEVESILVYSGLFHNHAYSVLGERNLHDKGQIKNSWLQLVQVLHRKTDKRWTERSDLVTDDLSKMYWKKLFNSGSFLPTNELTCEWTSHPNQRTKLILKSIWAYREYYKVKEPINFANSLGFHIDERNCFSKSKLTTNLQKKGLKILIVGELAYNPDRIVAIEEEGHQLFGLWMNDTYLIHSIGPLPFGNVKDIPYENWQNVVEGIKPDIIYAQLNSAAVPLAHEVLTKTNIPFVWHFKEAPDFCLNQNNWNHLYELFTKSDGQIYINEETKEWFNLFFSQERLNSFILDGDLPRKDYFTNNRRALLSEKDGEIHLLMVGRPVGLQPEDLEPLANQNIHFHLYGNYYSEHWKEWKLKVTEKIGKYFHIHNNCSPKDWVKEFSQYDAGWLHYHQSSNYKDKLKIRWHDLNYPARMSTLAAAGLPMIQFNNEDHIVSTQLLTTKLNIGIFFNNFYDLAQQLQNKETMKELRFNVWKNRMKFTFDYHLPSLINFFNDVIVRKKNS